MSSASVNLSQFDLGQLKLNLVGMFNGWSSTNFMFFWLESHQVKFEFGQFFRSWVSHHDTLWKIPFSHVSLQKFCSPWANLLKCNQLYVLITVHRSDLFIISLMVPELCPLIKKWWIGDFHALDLFTLAKDFENFYKMFLPTIHRSSYYYFYGIWVMSMFT